MLSTLRRRLTLSHALPLIVVIPLIGIALVYVLQTQVLLANLSASLTSQAVILGELTTGLPFVWFDPQVAQTFVERVGPRLDAEVYLIDPESKLLASTDPAVQGRLGQPVDLPGLSDALAGHLSVKVAYNGAARAEVTSVLVPVLAPDRSLLGVLSLSTPVPGGFEGFQRVRNLVVGILGIGLVVGALMGRILAINLERPVREVTQGIVRLAHGEKLQPLSEAGPEELRTLIRNFNSLVERQRDLEQARRQLVANLVHELGRPLGAMRSAIQALQAGADRGESLRRELLEGIEEEIERLRRLLEDLAHLQDSALGALELNRRPVAIQDWLGVILGPWREDAQRKGLAWESRIPDSLPSVSLDPDRMAQALGNLLSNAIKYTPTGGGIFVSAGVEGGETWIRVSDTGPGIDLQEQEQIFSPFFRGRAGGRFPQGMGLGLSIARDLVVAHGGRIEVSSTPGKGSQFTLWLPLSA